MILSQILTSGDLDEMLAFYSDVFGDIEVLEEKDFGGEENNQFRHIKMLDNEFFIMNGATPNGKAPALFYMVVYPEDRRSDLITLHEKLREGATDLSHVQDMWSNEDLYLVQDKYGVVWHFWLDEDCPAPVILPSMVMSDDLVGKFDELKAYYTDIFDSVEFGTPTYLENGLIDHVSIKLMNHELQVCETAEKDLFSLKTISSLSLTPDSQEEIDQYVEALGAHLYPGGWLADKMGVHWCIEWSGLADCFIQANSAQSQAIFGAIMEPGPMCIDDIKTAFEENK